MTEIVACPHPFKTERVDMFVPDGLTIEQIMATVQPRAELRAHAHVFIGDRLIDSAQWETVRPNAGEKLTVRMVPAGGGEGKKNPLSTVLTLAVMFAAPYAGIYMGGGLLGAFTTASVGMAGLLAVNAIAPPPRPRLAQLSGTDAKDSPTYNISGGRNRMAAYSPIPRVYGRHLVVPPYAAPPYSELVGQDQWMRFIFLLGYGPLLIEEPKIGETSIWNYEGTQFEVRQGFDDDPPLSLFPNQVTEEPLALTLSMPYSGADGWVTRTTAADINELGIEITFPTGLVRYDDSGNKQSTSVQVTAQYRQLPSGAWNNLAPITAFGSPQTIRLPAAPALIYDPAIESDNLAQRYDIITIEAITGNLNVRTGTPVLSSPVIPATPWGHYAVCAVWRESGTTVVVGHLTDMRDATLTASGAGNFLATLADTKTISVAIGDYSSGYLTVIAAKSSALRYGVATKVPYQGQYEVRVRRETLDSTDDKIFDDVQWTVLRSIKHRQAIEISRLPNMALAVLRVKATDSLAGIIDQFNCICTSILPAWNGTSWVEQPTTNTAAIYRDVFQGAANPRPVADARLDLTSLQEWAETCTAKGWQFNGVIDARTTVFQLANDVASTARGSFGMRDGLYSVVRDKPQTTPVQHFTPRNSWGFRGEKAFNDLPHGVKIRFVNAESGFKQDERIVYADDYDSSNATKFESMDLFGITSPAQAWSQGRYYLACAQLRPETYSINVDIEHIVCTRGDLVVVSHDVTLHGIAAGRTRPPNLAAMLNPDGSIAHNPDGSVAYMSLATTTECEIDERVPMESGKNYAVWFRRRDGTSLLVPVDTVPGENEILTFTTPLDEPLDGDELFSFGEVGTETVEMIVHRIEMLDDLAARLILVDAAPAVHTADVSIPAYDPQITLPVDITTFAPGVPEILSIISDERALIVGPDGSLISRIVVTVLPTGGATRTDSIEAQYRRGSEPWQSLTVAGGEIVIADVVDGVSYDIRVRALSVYKKESAWNTTSHVVVGKTSAPPDVTSFLVRRDADGTRVFTWSTVSPPLDLAGAQIRYKAGTGNVWEDMAPVHSGLLKASPYETNQLAAGEYTFAIKNIDTTNHQSSGALYIELTIGDPRLSGAIEIMDNYNEGFPGGGRVQCYLDSSTGYLLPWDNSNWAEIPATWADWASWNDDPVTSIEYSRSTDIGTVAQFTPLVTGSADGTIDISETHSTNGTDWTSYAAPGVEITARYIVIKISVAGSYPIIKNMISILSTTPTEETLDDVDTSTLTGSNRIGTGDIRLPITKTYAVIKKASIVLQNVGAGWTWELIDKDTTVGPRVKIYDNTGTLADATIDADIRGV